MVHDKTCIVEEKLTSRAWKKNLSKISKNI